MVVLANDPEQAERGFTPEKLPVHGEIAHEHRMPIDTSVRAYVAGSREACAAVVAARGQTRPSPRALLRDFGYGHFAGEQIDRPETIDGAARDAESTRRAHSDADADDVSEASSPTSPPRAGRSPAARVLDASSPTGPGAPLTCPSYEITRLADGVTIAVPGFQPFAVYDAILANLVPGLDRREPPARRRGARVAAVPLAPRRSPCARHRLPRGP